MFIEQLEGNANVEPLSDEEALLIQHFRRMHPLHQADLLRFAACFAFIASSAGEATTSKPEQDQP